MPDEFDCSYIAETIVCPYCGHEDTDCLYGGVTMTTPLERLRSALLNHGEFEFNLKHRTAIIETLEAVARERPCLRQFGPEWCTAACDWRKMCTALEPLLEEESE